MRVGISGVFLLLTGCGISKSETTNNEVDLKLKLNLSNSISPLYDDTDINKGNINNDEIAKVLMETILDRYKDLNDPSVAIEDYAIKKIDMVLETKKGSVFTVLYSVKGNATRTRWDANEQSDRWTTTQGISCSFYENADQYVLNIIGGGPLYYKGNEDKLNKEQIAKKLFEECYIEPHLFDGNKSSRLLSYNIDKVEQYMPGDNIKNRLLFNLDYSIQGIKGEYS
ncbi:hypothetical protein [Clostridium chromiireducens]|uniref:hypothetical protein n=1 Tax=Clostridium chromiireducens TaxID=225345 RepID=UPI001365E3D1|nr:hypothetical protein [Clostridium chromiireducens]